MTPAPGNGGKAGIRAGARSKLREYFLAHIGETLDAYTLREAAGGITEWARRARELRQLEGWDIRTDKDDSTLKPGEYRLAT